MSWVPIAGWSTLGLVALAVVVFVATSLGEREFRAALVTALAGTAILAAFLLPLVWAFPGNRIVLIVLMAVLVIGATVLAMPTGRPPALAIAGPQDPIDERDAVFHRFYKLEPGTEPFDAYYREHPGLKDFDDKIRAMPQLGTPGSKSYHPMTAPFQAAAAAFTDKMARDIESRPQAMEESPVEASPEAFAKRIKGFARHMGASAVGCTRLNPAYIYTHIARGPGPWGAPIALDHTHAVAIACEMSHEMIRHAPESPTLTETNFRYAQVGQIALVVARYINLLGYEARAHVDTNYRVMCVPIAVDAGLGELGRHGILITPRYGPRVRLSVVTTNLPLAQDPQTTFGVQHFCTFCRKCADICPSGSVDSGEKQVHAGVEKWQTRRDTCYRYWRIQGTDCSLCIKVCPYAHPSTPPHNAVRWLMGRNRLARRLGLWADDLCYGRKPKQRFPYPEWHEQH